MEQDEQRPSASTSQRTDVPPLVAALLGDGTPVDTTRQPERTPEEDIIGNLRTISNRIVIYATHTYIQQKCLYVLFTY